MNKKGFTLMELLAVIVILAVVILIGVKAVIPLIAKAQKNNLANEGLTLVDSGKVAYNAEQLALSELQLESSDSYCFSLDWLKKNNYYDKASNKYSGSVLVYINPSEKVDYFFWITNGDYHISGGSLDSYTVEDGPGDDEINNCGGLDLSLGGEAEGKNIYTVTVECVNCYLNTSSQRVVEGGTVYFIVYADELFDSSAFRVSGNCTFEDGRIIASNVMEDTSCTLTASDNGYTPVDPGGGGSTTPVQTYSGTIHYNSNGGTGFVTDSTRKPGESYTTVKTCDSGALCAPYPDYIKKNFQGWSTSPTGSVEYTFGDRYYGSEDITLYAVWGRDTLYYQEEKEIYYMFPRRGHYVDFTAPYTGDYYLSMHQDDTSNYLVEHFYDVDGSSLGFQDYEERAYHLIGGQTYSILIESTNSDGTFPIPAKLYISGERYREYHAPGAVNVPESGDYYNHYYAYISSQFPRKAGYCFAGWATYEGGPVVYQPSKGYTESFPDHFDLYAVWNPYTSRTYWPSGTTYEYWNDPIINYSTSNETKYVKIYVSTSGTYRFTVTNNGTPRYENSSDNSLHVEDECRSDSYYYNYISLGYGADINNTTKQLDAYLFSGYYYLVSFGSRNNSESRLVITHIN